MVDIRDTREDTEKGLGGTVPANQRDRTKGTAQDFVAEESVPLVGDRM